MKTININRLEKICNTELSIFQKQALYGWAKEFEDTVKSELEREYKQHYEENLGRGIDHFIIAIALRDYVKMLNNDSINIKVRW